MPVQIFNRISESFPTFQIQYERMVDSLKDSKLKVRIITIFAILLTMCLILPPLIIISIKKTSGKIDNGEIICKSSECRLEEDRISKTLNWTADPCSDFYEFACGGWEDWVKFEGIYYTLKNTNKQLDNMAISSYNFGKNVAKLLISIDKDGNSYPQSVRTMQTFIKTCYNPPETASGKEFEEYVKEKMDKLGSDQLFYIFVKMAINATLFPGKRIEFDKIELGLLAHLQEEVPLVGGFVEEAQSQNLFINEYWRLIYPTLPLGIAEVDDMLALEKDLLNISKISERKNETLNLESLKNLTDNLIDWESYFRKKYPDVKLAIDDWATQKIVVENINFIKNLPKVLKLHSEKTIRNYIFWIYAFDYGSYVSLEIARKFFKPTDKFTLIKRCFQITVSYFDMAIANIYGQKYFPLQKIKEAKNMMTSIQDAFKEMTLSQTGLSNEDKKSWIAKSDNLTILIGYPEWVLDPVALDNYYNNARFSKPDLFWMNNFEAEEWFSIRNLKKLNNHEDKRHWNTLISPINFETTSAYNFFYYNLIAIPLLYLQLSYGKPIDALNYGALGFTMGHELIHSFHDRFNTTCIENQYSSYKEPSTGIFVNGTKTVEENLGDNLGVKLAFDAFIKSGRKEKFEDNAKDKNVGKFTPEQLFFISYAQNFCADYTKEKISQLMQNDVHTLGMFRVKGVVENSPEFARAWNCPNFKPKCNIFQLSK